MVTGKEPIFDNIDLALDYVLSEEKKALSMDEFRQSAPILLPPPRLPFSVLSMSKVKPIPVDSLDYSLSAYFNKADVDKFVMTPLVSGRYSLKPNLRNRKFLFRGESEFHPNCVSNLFRNPKQNRFTAESVRGQELMLLMLSHPLVRLLDMGVELDGRFCRFEMNLYGLTQHYYNKTRFLDLTANPEVAAFFATTQYDWNTDTYTPIVDEIHKPGILYYYSLDVNEDFVKPGLSTIGLQVFPRSGCQYGFLYDLRKDVNFNDLPRLSAVFFRHNGVIAERISNSFHQGKALFPDDILTEHWKRFNRDKMIISNRTVRLNSFFNPDKTVEELESEIRLLGFVIQDYVPSFTTEELETYYDSIEFEGSWINFCKQIHIPGDSNGRMMEDLVNLPSNPKYKWAFERNSESGQAIDFKAGFLLNKYQSCLV